MTPKKDDRDGDVMTKPEPPPAPPADVKRTAEEIATARGWLPPFTEGPGGRMVKNENWWRFAAAFGHRPQGQEVTEKEFDAAVHAAINATHG